MTLLGLVQLDSIDFSSSKAIPRIPLWNLLNFVRTRKSFLSAFLLIRLISCNLLILASSLLLPRLIRRRFSSIVSLALNGFPTTISFSSIKKRDRQFLGIFLVRREELVLCHTIHHQSSRSIGLKHLL
ncbi:hypothetical protein EJ04DRAFT_101613 [Polyplosphaeria fusca]|uniref:Uncharacterized protein n=1 Tax=Polyplosphaeria fusca TaxID=682080 RepID=A0A9P4QMG0_9PLEO|nr:hypothetical protein EJ04DRAFT_101613 [Polyplosphaeria fusca]